MTVDQVYDTVSSILAEQQRGRLTSDDFNNIVNLAQDKLLQFYVEFMETNQEYMDALSPFIKEETISLVSGSYPLQVDFRAETRGSRYVYSYNPTGGGNAEKKEIRTIFLRQSQVDATVNSPIRGANFAKERLYHTIRAGQIYLYPSDLTGQFIHKYVRNPVKINYAVTQDITNNVENFDAAGSTNPEWLDRDFDNLVDLTLFLTGASIRANSLVQTILAQSALKEAI